MRGGNIRHDVGLHGEPVDPLHKVPRRPDLERYPGETNRDALRRISGIALAAEHDRDAAKAAIERVLRLADQWEADAASVNSTTGWQMWVQVRDAVKGPAA